MGHDNLKSCFASTVPQPPPSHRVAHVQCLSRATCEQAFSKQNLIKTKVGSMLGNKNLEAMLRIALEGPE